MNKKELLVAGLQNGTVIDHIPSDRLFKVVSMLKLDTLSNPITIGNNLISKKSGTKGIIKVTDKYFEKNEIDRVALIAPHAKLNRIANYEICVFFLMFVFFFFLFLYEPIIQPLPKG